MPQRENEFPMIRAATLDDASALVAIYNHFVDHTIVTFEEAPVSAADFARRMQAVMNAALPYLVAERGGVVVGYACATRWKERSGYRHSVESTVYLAPDEAGHGLGTALYEALFARLAAWGAHAVMGGIALPNEASVALHEKLGMRKVAHFEAVGLKFGRWIDVGYWQRVLPH
ncbi:MAG: arsinothricin resistance N-acetyltransferase ArsN1 family B [Gemmatimonadota bacterium]